MQRYHRNKPHIIQRMNGWATVLIVQSRLQAKLSWSIFFENLRNTLASSMQISLWGEPVGPLPCIDLTPVPRHAALDTWLTAQLLPSVCCSIDVHPAVMLRASRWVDVEVKVAEPTQFAQRNHTHTHTHTLLRPLIIRLGRPCVENTKSVMWPKVCGHDCSHIFSFARNLRS